MEVDEVPNVNENEIINEIPSEKTETIQTPTGEIATEMYNEQIPHDGDGEAVPIQDYLLYTPSATSSKSKCNVSNDMKKKEIQEFFSVIRPHLPRKSKSKAYQMLQNIVKGTVAKSSFERIIRKKKSKKRPARKQRTRLLKKESLSVVRRNDRSLYGSSDSCRSNTSCPHCGYSCSRIARY